MITSVTFAFLRELGINNNTQRMHAHRDLYLQEKSHFEKFIGVLLDQKKSIDSAYADIDIKQCLFRINRDIRFTKDKSPYKTYFSAYLSPQGKKSYAGGGLYIHIEPHHRSIVGGGLYMPSPAQLKLIRTALCHDLSCFEDIVSASSFKNCFGEIQGRKRDTLPRGYDAMNTAAHRLLYQDFYVQHGFSDIDILAPNIIDIIRQSWEALQPLNQYLEDVIGIN